MDNNNIDVDCTYKQIQCHLCHLLPVLCKQFIKDIEILFMSLIRRLAAKLYLNIFKINLL